MSGTVQARAGLEVEVLFNALSTAGDLLSGITGFVATLTDPDGPAAETVTITEVGLGVYKATFTTTKSSDAGITYLLDIQCPVNITDGALLSWTIQSFQRLAANVVGGYLTTLELVRELLGLADTDTSGDPLIVNMIARVSAMIEGRLSRRILQASYQEIRDGNGTPLVFLLRPPVASISAIYSDLLQTWDSTTLIDAADYSFDPTNGRVYLRNGGWFAEGFQNVRVDYVGGYSVVPPDVEGYACMKAAEVFRQRTTLGISSMSLKDGSFTRSVASAKDLMADLDDEIGHYHRRRAV